MQPILLFPGQGSQVAGMGRDVAEAHSEAMDVWKKAESISGLGLREIFWEGDEAAMSDTRALQVALTVVNCNLWAQMAGRVQPLGAAGHSLGEFSALAAAGILPLEDVLQITALRGRLMAEADPDGKGGMCAIVKLAEDAVQQIVSETVAECGEALLTANFNTPAQFVISGTTKAIALASEKAKAAKGRAIPLKVSGAFHSPLMAEANAELAPLLEKAHWSNGKFPVYCNATGQPVQDADTAKANMLKQMVSPVRWIECVQAQYAAGARFWLELGPKAVLGKMVAPCANAADDIRVELVSDEASLQAVSL